MMAWQYSTDDGELMHSGRLGISEELAMKYGWAEQLKADPKFYYDADACYWMQHAISPWAAINWAKNDAAD